MSDQNLPLNIAIVGAGLIGERHARLLASMQEFTLCALVDPSPSAKELADELSSELFSDLLEFLESGTSCDGVIIATPNETHLPFALACFKSKLPCLIEKPLASNSEDAKAIVGASVTHKIKVLVGHHRRHHQISSALKEKIDQGSIGRIVGAQLTWMLRKPDEYFKTGEWRTQKGGGPIWINLIHEIDLLRFFMGEIIEVSAMLSNNVRSNEVEDTGIINMRFESGALASAILSDCTPSPWHFEGGSGENPNIAPTGHGGLRIFGVGGALEFPSLTTWQHDNDEGHWGKSIHAMSYHDASIMDGEAALTAQLKNFEQVIRGSAEPLVSAQDGLQSVRVVEAIHEAAITNKNVRIAYG